jgi:inner membrane protein
MFALVIVAFAFARAAQKWKTGLLALLSFYVHLLEDVTGSRGPDGYQWPVSYWPVLFVAATCVARIVGP